jgi:Methyltransferase domain
MSDESLDTALARIREVLLADEPLVRAVGSGRRRSGSAPAPSWRRVELRYVDLKAGRHLQVTMYDDTQAHTANYLMGAAAAERIDALLAEPFSNWHIDTTTAVYQLRVTKKGRALLGSTRAKIAEPARSHDKPKARLLPADDPVLIGLGISTADGQVKPSTQAKYRQVEEFLRLLDSSITDSLATGHLRQPTPDDPLRIVDLGCGNAYLTFAAQRYLTSVRALPVRLIGVDVKSQSYEHNAALAESLGMEAEFVVASIAEVDLPAAPDVVLALHACDTATDEALSRAAHWRSPPPAVITTSPPNCARLIRPRHTPCSPETASCVRDLPTP